MNNTYNEKDISSKLFKYAKFILLVTFVIYVASVRFSLQKNAEHQQKNYSASDWPWVQPESLNKKHPILIEKSTWLINFGNIESILWQSKVSRTSQLVIDSETTDLLQKIANELPDNLNNQELQRLRLLIEQSLVGSNENKGGGEFVDLLSRYYYYQKEYSADLAQINNAQGELKISLLKELKVKNKQRQEDFFGGLLSKKLFDKKNITTNYFNDRRLINMDKKLTKKQKKEQLSQLKKHYIKTL